MKYLKGITNLIISIENAIQKYIHLKVNVEMCNEFLWADDENTLFFTPLMAEKSDKLWKEWIENTFNIEFDSIAAIYYFSFLHELGHKMTLNDVTDDEYDEGTELSNGDDYIAYWNCYREYIATKWAVDFCLKHQKEMENFSKTIYESLEKFYEINEITS